MKCLLFQFTSVSSLGVGGIQLVFGNTKCGTVCSTLLLLTAGNFFVVEQWLNLLCQLSCIAVMDEEYTSSPSLQNIQTLLFLQ